MKKILLLLGLIVLLMSCAGNKPKANWTATQYYEYAKKIFNDEDYLDASNQFTVIVLRYPGSSIADSAQYYLAESQFKMKEYLVAASEYEKLITNYSRSPMVPKAQYKLADCYFELSPRAPLDQEYTEKAIRALQSFIEDYPTDKLRTDAGKKLSILRDKLAKKKYLSAEVYRKMRKYRAALIYYNEVLDKYYDSSWADDAMAGKIETFVEEEEFIKARNEIDKFKQQFPASKLLKDVDELAAEIPLEK